MRGAEALIGLALLLTGCFNPFHPRVTQDRGISEPAPQPDLPENALRLFEWCWEHRSITEYEELFTDDFRFAFASTDSFGNAYSQLGFTREDEIESARHLFLGGDANQPAASQITLNFDSDLQSLPDNRPGKRQPWHQEIDTHVQLTIHFTGTGGEQVNGNARFFLVRGDSAVIPRDLRDRGFGPDPNRWYIERYEEADPGLGATRSPTDPSAVALTPRPFDAARPTSGTGTRSSAAVGATRPATMLESEPGFVSWGRIKVLYR